MFQYASLKQISELDRIAMEEAGLDILQMMEMAGNKFAIAVKDFLLHLHDKKILVLAGTGHNGGDGLSAARYLNNWGASVNVILAKDKVKPAVSHHLTILKSMGVNIRVNSGKLTKSDLIIDALLGYNQRGDPSPPYDDLIDKANESDSSIFAFDNPSGLNAETGEAASPTIKATATVTLAVVKKGLDINNTKKYVGHLFLVDLGIPKWVYDKSGLEYPFQKLEKNYYI